MSQCEDYCLIDELGLWRCTLQKGHKGKHRRKGISYLTKWTQEFEVIWSATKPIVQQIQNTKNKTSNEIPQWYLERIMKKYGHLAPK